MSSLDESTYNSVRHTLKYSIRKKNVLKSLKSPYFEESRTGICYGNEISPTLVSCTQKTNVLRLEDSFFMQPCIELAQNLLGKIIVRKLISGDLLKGKIVETESYLGVDDMASHSYKGKRTDRNEAMYLKPGTAYVYTIYGMYFCLNISSLEEGSAVLIRAVEPLEGLSNMLELRRKVRKSISEIKTRELCNGPSKLCQAFKIQKDLFNKVDLTVSENLWLEEGVPVNASSIISCKRIGIDSHGEEWANKPLRFYVKNNSYVSRRNKIAEKIHEEKLSAELH